MDNFICNLTSICWLRVSGPDAESFLHGQLSNDLHALDQSHVQFNAYCNAKGRMFCLMQAQRNGDDFILQLPCELQDAVLHKLRMYVMRANVDLRPQVFACLGVAGQKAESALVPLIGELPQQIGEVIDAHKLRVAKQHSAGLPQYLVYGTPDDVEPVRSDLSKTLDVLDEPAWWYQGILAGVPRVLQATSETFIPQMVNLDLLDGINFHKGCYPGQEIIARMRYLGKLKQRMQRAHGDAVSDLPAPGDKIDSNDRTVGTVVDAQPDGQGGFEVLAVLQLGLEDNAALTLPQGATLTIRPLPYSLQSNEQNQA